MECNPLKRRDFITLVGGTIVAWPIAAGAQQSKIARIGEAEIPQSSSLLMYLRVLSFQSETLEAPPRLFHDLPAGRRGDR
jgi:hypothetical protein